MFDSFTLNDLPTVARTLIDSFSNHKVWAFEAEMGSGKTTLILEILKQLGIKDADGSPTYSLVNSYTNETQNDFFHFDMYRLNSIHEALDIGIEEMLYDEKAFCLIEWPKKIEELLPRETIWLYLSAKEDGCRRLEVRI